MIDNVCRWLYNNVAMEGRTTNEMLEEWVDERLRWSNWRGIGIYDEAAWQRIDNSYCDAIDFLRKYTIIRK